MSTDERLVNLETEVLHIRDLFEAIETRIEGTLERLSTRVNDLEYRGLNDVKNDIYSLERKVDGMEREISSIQNQIRYR